jgi:hypothetical protein
VLFARAERDGRELAAAGVTVHDQFHRCTTGYRVLPLRIASIPV